MIINTISVGVDQLTRRSSNQVFSDLRYAASDASNFHTILNSQISVNSAALLADSGINIELPTRANILLNLTHYSKPPYSNQPLIFFFTGHGINIGSDFYICPSDFINEISSYSGIKLDSLIDIASKREAWTLFIFDCCRSSLENDKNNVNQLGKMKYSLSDEICVMFSCSVNEKSIETNLNDSIFGGIFIHFLSNYLSLCKDEFINLNEAFEYAKEKTSTNANSVFNIKQVPYYIGPSLSDFYLKKKELTT